MQRLHDFGTCFFGAISGKPSVDIKKDAANFWGFHGCEFLGGSEGIIVRADGTAGNQLDSLIIDGCLFQGVTVTCIQMDRVLNAVISNNIDRGTPSSGSWITLNTGNLAGHFSFSNNRWHTTTPGNFDTGSVYDFSNNTGGNRIAGLYESAETSLNNDAQTPFAHGLGIIPKRVQIILRANTATAQGWANNEEMEFHTPYFGTSSANDGVDVTADATNVYITAGTAIILMDHGATFTTEAITQSEYDWVVRAWL